MSVQIAKKISMKALCGNIAALIPMKIETFEKDGKEVNREVRALGETTWLANVVGLARGVKTGMSNYGEWSALQGEFVAEALEGEKKGTRYRTGQLFLPDVALFLVTPLVYQLDKGGAVEVAFKIGITAVTDDVSNTGYEYTAEFLIEPSQNDPLEMMLAKVAPALENKEKPKGK